MVFDANPEEILGWETKRLWNAISSLDNVDELNITKEELSHIRHGFKINVPIWYFTEEWYELYPASKKAKIRGYGKFKMEDFMQEKETRDAAMRNALLASIQSEGPITGRVGGNKK